MVASIQRYPDSYSLWFIPDEPQEKLRLQEAISRLATDFAGPLFVPHVTLVGGVPGDLPTMQVQAARLAKTLKPFNVVLGEVQWRSAFFQSFFMTVKATPKLLEARRLAETVFGAEPLPFSPHLSLFYGEKSIVEKQRMRAQITVAPFTFEASKIYLAHNDEKALQWKILSSYDLRTMGASKRGRLAY